VSTFLKSAKARNGLSERSDLLDFHGHEFKGSADFFQAIARQGDGRWQNYCRDIKAASGMSEFADPDGASMVPLAVREEIWRAALDIRSLPLAWASAQGTRANGYSLLAYPTKDATSGRFGFKTSILAEGEQAASPQKIGLRKVSHKLLRRQLYIRATEELIEDSAMANRIAPAIAETFAHDISVDILNGTGVGRPLGIAKSGAAITVTATSASGTIDAAAILKAWSSLSPDSRNRCVWFADPQVEETWYSGSTVFSDVLRLMRFAEPGEAENGPNATLLGRPFFASEAVVEAGLSLVLADMSAYQLVFKVPGPADKPVLGETPPIFPLGVDHVPSAHIYFDTFEYALKYRLRHDGRPLFDAPRTLADGSTIVSPFVVVNPAA
jgi:hypothetical protein